ncbi:MAG: MFS transporter [Armatimonadota bacterium]|nr:MFS transporter [Armatimonadota bacterium]MDR5696262.1 MFS transporter [Armatimonadota bacterium]
MRVDPAVARPRSMLAPLRHRDFRLLWTGLLVSNTGSWMQFVAVGYLIDRLTLSPFYLGLLALCQGLPRLVFAVVGGALADRWDRRALLFWTNAFLAASALVLTLLTVTGVVEVWHVILIAALNSVVMSFDMPARHSMVPALVEEDEVLQAVSLNSVAFNGAGIFGPSLGGALIAVVGEAGCFAINTLSYAGVLVALARMSPTARREVASGDRVFEEIREAFALLRTNRVVLWALLSVAVLNFFGRPYFRLMPAFAREVLHTDATGLGLLQAAPGLGTVLSAWYVSRVVGRSRGRLLSGATLWFGACVVLFALSGGLWPALLLLVATGLFQSVAMSSANALVQTSVDPGMRGRAMGLYSMTAFGMFALGSFPLGALAAFVGVPASLTLGGALTAVVALALRPRLRGVA